MGLALNMARAGARQHGHPTVPAEDLLSVNRGKKKKLVTELIVRLATPGVDTVMFPPPLPLHRGVSQPGAVCRSSAVFV